MSPFELLGLAPDADIRSIKRAYARLVRITRPEDDPDGFQRLHAAYRAALHHAESTTGTTVSSPEHGSGAAPAGASPCAIPMADMRRPEPVAARSPPRQAAERFDVETFCGQAIEQAGGGDAEALDAWLHTCPALWSLECKADTGRRLLDRLYREPPPMPGACQQVLLHFFDLDHVGSGIDPLRLHSLRRRMQLRWNLLPAHRRELARTLPGTQLERNLMGAHLRLLETPLRYPQVLWRGLNWETPRRLARLIRWLAGNGHPADLSPPLDAAQVQFWLEAADTGRPTRTRMLLGIARCALALLLAGVLGLGIGLMAVAPATGIDWGAASILPMLVGLPCLLWVAWFGYQRLRDWHAHPEHARAGWRWLNLALVPLLCGIAAAAWLLRDGPAAAMPVLILATWLSLSRYLRRTASHRFWSHRSAVYLLYLVLPASVWFTAMAGYGVQILLATALVPWAFDLWWRRRRLWAT